MDAQPERPHPSVAPGRRGRRADSPAQADAGSVTERTYQTVLDMILARELPPGQVIEERRLAERLAVSRTPLRSAVNRLLGEGVLARLSNGLTVVREVGVAELLELVQLRRLLEGEAAALAAGRVPQPALDRLRRRIEGVIAAARAAKQEHWTLDDELHDLIAAHCGNRSLAAFVADVRRRVRMCNIEREPGRLIHASREHLAIIDALDAADGPRARQAMIEHLDQVRRTFVRGLGLDAAP